MKTTVADTKGTVKILSEKYFDSESPAAQITFKQHGS